MMDHSDTTLRAAIKALEEVVAPAVDPGDPLAGQQLRLVIDALRFLRDRVDHLHDRERFEVRHHLRLARAVAPEAAAASPAAAHALREAIEAGDAILDRSDARTPELRAASAALAAELRSLVRDAAGAGADARSRIERLIVDGTRERIDADRAWHLPQGFDPDPGGVRPLEAVLGLADPARRP
jgi:hypothetical protein